MNLRSWTQDEVDRLKKMVEQGSTAVEIAAALGRTEGQVRGQKNRLAVALRQGTPAGGPVDPVQVAEDRMRKLRDLREERAELQAVAGERSLRKMIEHLFRDIAPRMAPPAPYREVKSKAAHPVEETALLNFSDWHYGEVVSSARTRGLNEYDQEIARERVQTIVRASRSILRRMRLGGYTFPRLVVAANGDMVTGSLHDLEKHSNGKAVTESVYECGMLLAEAIRDLSADFPKLDVYCTSGNHGRLPDAKRMEQKAPLRNWDTLVYLFAKTALRDLPNVTFEIPDSYSVGYQVEGLNILQGHGHDIKSWNSIPWYGIDRYVNRISGMEASRSNKIDAYIFGHFHRATNMPHATGEMFVNGSLIGGTEFSVNGLGVADKPVQWLLGVHHDRGITHRWPIQASA